MPTLWFWIVAVMLTAYVILDGFDIGAGIIHLLVARSDRERRASLRAIGPVWDGNEVWLLAAGGTLYFAFPLLYASSFSGFYLPLMMVLWLLMGRGISVELRSHLDGIVWRAFFDTVFSVSSILLAIFYGAALGNVIRGVPLRADGYFFVPLWTNWRVGPQPGVLDWYTVGAGVAALAILALHGALYVGLKTSGEVNSRARRVANVMWPVVLALTIACLLLTLWVRPGLLGNYRQFPVALAIPLVVFASLALVFYFHRKGQEKPAFVCSSVYIAFMLVGAAVALFPNVLPASTEARYSLTIHNTAAPAYGLNIGIIWWVIGMALALGYFVFVYRKFRGKVQVEG
jgi:cytochrome d ubiquinol oxidase subunit II